MRSIVFSIIAVMVLGLAACAAPATPATAPTLVTISTTVASPIPPTATNTAAPPTATNTATATHTATRTATNTHTPTLTSSPTNMSTATHTATATSTSTSVPTNTPTLTRTRVPPTRKPATPKPSYEIPPGEQGFLIQNLTGTPITVRAASVGGEPREFQIGVNGEVFMTTPAPVIVWGIVLGDGSFQSGGFAVIQPGQLKTVKIYKIPGGSCYQPECFEYFPPN